VSAAGALFGSLPLDAGPDGAFDVPADPAELDVAEEDRRPPFPEDLESVL